MLIQESQKDYATNPATEKMNTTDSSHSDPQKELVEQIQNLLNENVELDRFEIEQEIQFENDKIKAQSDLEKAEQSLIENMQKYVEIEDTILDLETHYLHQQSKLEDLSKDLSLILSQIELETPSIDHSEEERISKSITKELNDLSNLHSTKTHKQSLLTSSFSSISVELSHCLDNHLQIQILSTHPYLISVHIDGQKKYTVGHGHHKADYFSSIERFTKVAVGQSEQKFDMIVQDELIQYFNQGEGVDGRFGGDFSCSEGEFGVVSYMAKYLEVLLNHVRRIQRPAQLFIGSFKSSKSHTESA